MFRINFHKEINPDSSQIQKTNKNVFLSNQFFLHRTASPTLKNMHSRSLSVREIGKKLETEDKDHNGTSQKNFISFTQGIKTDPVFFESGSPSVSDRKKMFFNSPSTP